jgi:hypothetical protein
MDAWVWIVIAAAVVAAAALIWMSSRRARTRRLRDGFGPEYDRAIEERGDRRDAEAHLREREERRDALDIRPLTPAARERYAQEWGAVQARFVDEPVGAVAEGRPQGPRRLRRARPRGGEHGGPPPGDGPLPRALRRVARQREHLGGAVMSERLSTVVLPGAAGAGGAVGPRRRGLHRGPPGGASALPVLLRPPAGGVTRTGPRATPRRRAGPTSRAAAEPLRRPPGATAPRCGSP